MSDVLDAALSTKCPLGLLPDWVIPFSKAVAQLELLFREAEERIARRNEQDGDVAEEQNRSREDEMASIGEAEANLRNVSHIEIPLQLPIPHHHDILSNLLLGNRQE